MIARAKRSFRAYVAGHCGFPEGPNGVQEAKECLEDAVEVHIEEGGVPEPGMYCFIPQLISLTNIRIRN